MEGSSVVDALVSLPGHLADLDLDALSDTQRLSLLTVLERLKGSAASCQARAVVAFDRSQRAGDASQGVRAEKQGAGVAIQVGLSMRTSHAKARRFVGLAYALRELPHTHDALAAGDTSEHRAFLIAKETIHLTLADRLTVDRELQGAPGGIGALGDRDAETRSRAIAQRLDPAGAVRRHSAAVKKRRVSLRPAPDGMCRLSAVLPLPDGVRTWATLDHAATTARATGDQRSRGEVMADELVARVTTPAISTGEVSAPDVTVDLVMTDGALLGSDDDESHHEPAQVVTDTGLAGHLPADVARGLVRDAARVWIRRLYTDPTTGDLVAMDSRARLFNGQLRHFLVLRDQRCRTPWCDAPVRHADHVTRWHDGGPTTASNGQGLCEACNHAKQAADLVQRTMVDGSVTTITTSGHTYRSHPPRPPGRPRLVIDWSTLERSTRARAPA